MFNNKKKNKKKYTFIKQFIYIGPIFIIIEALFSIYFTVVCTILNLSNSEIFYDYIYSIKYLKSKTLLYYMYIFYSITEYLFFVCIFNKNNNIFIK